MKIKWTTEFPKQEGNYWFWGYRCYKCEPEWMVLKVRKCANGFVYMAEGQFMYKSEVEEPHFAPITLPDFPELKP